MKRIVLFILLSLGLTGCQSGIIEKLVKAPEVKSVQLKSFSAQNKTITFDVGLFNPNAFSLPIDGFNGGVILNGLDVGRFAATTETSLAAQETQTISLPITLDAEAFGRAARSVLSEGKALYNFNGGVDTSVGQVPFSQDGELSMQDIIKTLMPSFRLVFSNRELNHC